MDRFRNTATGYIQTLLHSFLNADMQHRYAREMYRKCSGSRSLPIGQVEYDDDPHGSPVAAGQDGPVPLLTTSIPHLLNINVRILSR
jgi:hypothetical protein